MDMEYGRDMEYDSIAMHHLLKLINSMPTLHAGQHANEKIDMGTVKVGILREGSPNLSMYVEKLIDGKWETVLELHSCHPIDFDGEPAFCERCGSTEHTGHLKTCEFYDESFKEEY